MNNVTIDKKKLIVNDDQNFEPILNLINNLDVKRDDALNSELKKIKPGDLIRMGYKIPEGEKERLQYYEGIIISIQNRLISKTFKIRRFVQGVYIEQTFLVHSPKIVSLVILKSSKVRRAKLYFLRNLKGKATRLKIA